ncbi:MAG: branched-chain amino acid ABC transporter permease, partial [Burkholderiales bacterium]
FYLDVVTQVGIFAALALGLNVVVGFAGLLDLGFVAFFAVGAYTWAIFGSGQANQFTSGGFPLPADLFFVFLFLGVIVAALAGVLLGLPVLRLRGDYLAIVTLGFGEVIRVLANNLDKPVNLTNGPQGITSIGQPLAWLADLAAKTGIDAFRWQAMIYYLLVLAIITVAIFYTRRLDDSKIGRAWVAIREDEIAAQAMGVPLVRTKLIAFATGASFAGAMGVVFASKQTFVSPESFDFNQSVGILAMVVLGGLGSIRGVILGASIVTILNLQVLKAVSGWINGLRASGVEVLGFSLANLPTQFEPSKYERLIFGLILIAMMLYRPQGLVPAQRAPVERPQDREEAKR